MIGCYKDYVSNLASELQIRYKKNAFQWDTLDVCIKLDAVARVESSLTFDRPSHVIIILILINY